MNVGELIKKLKNFDPDMEVVFAYDYGDRTHSQVTQDVEDLEEVLVVYSDYHSQFKIVEDEDDVPNLDTKRSDGDARDVLVLR